MNIEKILASGITLFDQEAEAIVADLQSAVAKAVEERTRDSGENAQKHPLQSSTNLKEARKRAHANVTRLEKKLAPVIGSATAGLVAIAFAREYACHIEKAIELDQGDKREQGETGLYPAARKKVDRLWEAFEVGKWHWAQQTDQELKIYADLMRWKGHRPLHNDPNSPWPELFAIRESDDRIYGLLLVN